MADDSDISDQFSKFLDAEDSLSRMSNMIRELTDDTLSWGKAGANVTDAMDDVSKKMKETAESASDYSKGVLEIRDYSQELEVAQRKMNAASVAGNTSMLDKWTKIAEQIEEAKEQQDVFSAAQEYSTEQAGALSDNILGMFDKIPVVGGLISESIGLDGIKEDLTNSLVGPMRQSILDGKVSAGSLKQVFTASFSAIGKAVKGLMANPILLVGLLLVAAVQRFLALDKAAEDFSKSTGMLASNMRGVEMAARETSAELSNLGVSIDDAYKSASALAKVFNNNAGAIKGNLKFVAEMEARLGVSAESSAKLLQTFTGMGNMSSKTAQASMAIAAEMAKTAGVAPAQIMDDMANSSEKTLTMMRGNVGQMMRLAVESRRVGISMDSVTGAARGHLDFQSSINAEMELATLTGKNINLQKMRQLAFEGDMVGMLEEQKKQMKGLGDISKMNVFQQEAVAKAFGMSIEEVIKMQAQETFLQEQRANMSADEKIAFDAKLAQMDVLQAKQDEMMKLEEQISMAKATGTEHTKSNLEAAAKLKAMQDEQLASLSKEDQMRRNQSKMMDELKSLWLNISDVLFPIVNIIVSVLVPILQVVGALVRGFIKPFQQVFDLLFGVSDKVGESGDGMKKFIDMAIKAADFVGQILGWAMLITKAIVMWPLSLKVLGASIVVNVLRNFEKVKDFMGRFFTWASDKLSDIIIEFGPSILNTLKELPSKIFDVLTTPFRMLMNFIGGLFGVENLGSTITDNIKTAFTTAIEFATEKFQGLIDWVLGKFDMIMGKIKSVTDIGGKVGDKIKDIGGSIAGGASDFWEGAKSMIPFAEGGIVTGPTNALIGEAGPEAVIPLDKLESLSSSDEKIDKTNALLEQLIGLMQSGGISVNMDGKKVSAAISSATAHDF